MNTPGDRISRAEELVLPADLPAMREVFSQLTSESARSFAAGLLEALDQVGALGDLRPLIEVVEAWFWTLVLVRRGGFEGAIEEASKVRERQGMELSELLERYRLPEPDAERGQVVIRPMIQG